MAEFQTSISRFLQINEEYSFLMQKLKEDQERCLKNLKENYQLQPETFARESEACREDETQFQKYLRYYSKLYVDNGVAYCQKKLEKEKRNDSEAAIQCVRSYNAHMHEFEKNVVSELQRAVYKYDLNNL